MCKKKQRQEEVVVLPEPEPEVKEPKVVLTKVSSVPIARPADFIQLTPIVQPVAMVPYSTQEQPMLMFDGLEDDYVPAAETPVAAPMAAPVAAPVAAAPAVAKKKPKVKRQLFVILVAICALLFVAVSALSFFKVLPEFTSLYQYSYEKSDMGDALKEAAEEVGVNDKMGLDDIVYGSMDKFFGEKETEEVAEAADDEAVADEVAEEETKDSIYRDIVLSELNDESETMFMIACYAAPIAILLSIICALYILIKSIICACSKKRHQLWFSNLLWFIVTVLGVVFMYLAVNTVWEIDVLNFLTMAVAEGELVALTIGIGSYIMVALSLIGFVFSLFAYRSRKKAGDVKRKKRK